MKIIDLYRSKTQLEDFVNKKVNREAIYLALHLLRDLSRKKGRKSV